MREQLLDRMIAIYGYEHHVVIEFARLIEDSATSDWFLEKVVEDHENRPIWVNEEF